MKTSWLFLLHSADGNVARAHTVYDASCLASRSCCSRGSVGNPDCVMCSPMGSLASVAGWPCIFRQKALFRDPTPSRARLDAFASRNWLALGLNDELMPPCGRFHHASSFTTNCGRCIAAHHFLSAPASVICLGHLHQQLDCLSAVAWCTDRLLVFVRVDTWTISFDCSCTKHCWHRTAVVHEGALLP